MFAAHEKLFGLGCAEKNGSVLDEIENAGDKEKRAQEEKLRFIACDHGSPALGTIRYGIGPSNSSIVDYDRYF